MTKLSVTLPDKSAAYTLERVVHAAMGWPCRGEGIPVGHGRHVPPNEVLTWVPSQIQEIDGRWTYPYDGTTHHLVMRSLMGSSRQSERDSIIRHLKADDARGYSPDVLSGVFRKVLSDFEPRLWGRDRKSVV